MKHTADYYVFWGCVFCAVFFAGMTVGTTATKEQAKVCAPAQAGEKLVSTSTNGGTMYCSYAQGYQTGRAIKRRKA